MLDGIFPVAFGSSRSHSSLYCAGKRARWRMVKTGQQSNRAR